METKTLAVLLAALALPVALPAWGQALPGPQTYKGLELSIAGVERAASAGLSDCPPGSNSQRAMSRPGEEFAIVEVHVRVLPDYQPSPLGSPVLTDTEGNTYRTAAFFLPAGDTSEYTCAFPFRVPEGAALRSILIDELSLEIPSSGTAEAFALGRWFSGRAGEAEGTSLLPGIRRP